MNLKLGQNQLLGHAGFGLSFLEKRWCIRKRQNG
jgi:hypothetical protein